MRAPETTLATLGRNLNTLGLKLGHLDRSVLTRSHAAAESDQRPTFLSNQRPPRRFQISRPTTRLLADIPGLAEIRNDLTQMYSCPELLLAPGRNESREAPCG